MHSLFKKVIVAVNGSEQSIHASMYSILMAKQLGCELKAVYVVDTATIRQLTLSKFLISDESNNYEKSLEEEGKKLLESVVQLSKQKGVKIQTELRKGAVWSELITCAEEYKADLIVLGGKEHDRVSVESVLKKDHVSATNFGIVGYAGCNVLIVREKDIEKRFKIE